MPGPGSPSAPHSLAAGWRTPRPPAHPARPPARRPRSLSDSHSRQEYFESIGALIHEEDLAAIAGSAGDGVVAADGTALLAAEFSDFDDELGGKQLVLGAAGNGASSRGEQ